MARIDLTNAKRAKNDEFYTQLDDIAKEMKNYKPYFEGKVVLCNCDDPFESNFFKYFALNFNTLGLKKLIATCYNGSPIAGDELPLLFEVEELEPKKVAHKVEISEVADYNGDGAVNLADVKHLMQNDKNVISVLKGNGDFRSQECIELLKQADIVVTNPPFSLFREYVSQLVQYNKSFIIIGNTNALACREIFKLFQENKIRTGYTNFNVGMYFMVPDSFEKYHHIENGKKMARVSTSCWYTNLPVSKHNEDIILYKRYTPIDYPTYDNYNAINVNTYVDIPCDYDGVMGVPVTFLDKYNPNQFEIIWRGGDIEWAENECTFYTPPTNAQASLFKSQDRTWRIQNPYLLDNQGNAHVVYQRIFIRNKKPQKL
ncbi:MAG: adenine-specific methyltransferase EcoRI family protein [Paludibacteraceae bacterium]|nr:adenine-specific methyltransferase EcoRI family protein [Paludibacteraceae bacterium]